MINVSNEFKELMSERQDFKEYAEVTLANGTVLELTEDDFSIDNNSLVDSAGVNSIPLGVALSRNVQLEIMNDDDHLSDYDFFGAKIRLYLTFELSSTTEKVEYGIFTVTQPENYGNVVTIVGYDDMYKADKTFSTSLSFPATAKSLLIDICTSCGILIGNSNFSHNDFQIPSIPSDEYTYRQVIGFIAMIACGNARIDRTGRLQIISYDFNYNSGSIHELIDNYNTLTNDTNDVQVTGVQMTRTVTKTTTDEDGEEVEDEEEETVKVGSDGYVLDLENPLVKGHEETLISWIYDKFKSAKFRGFTMDYISYPLAEFGDKIKVTDWKGRTFYSVLTDVNFVFFGYTTLQNSAESPLRNQSSYSSGNESVIIKNNKLIEREKTNRENAVKKLNESLKNSSGMYSTAEKQPDGSTIYYLHDKPTIAESQNVIKLTAEAIGFSTDGGKTYPYGFTITGEMITRLLYTEGINANYINTGAITVIDSTGNIIFQVDMDTGKVAISGDNISIGGKKLTEEIEDIKKAGNLILKMDNEYQGISVDHEGNYVKFPKVTFTVQTFWGQTDVTKDTTFSFAKSDGVDGTFDTSSKVYTVTSLTTDTGWIDVTAKYITHTTRKRFNISKIKDGTSGRTYFMETSSSIVKMSADNTIVPNYITLSGYYRDGAETARTAYKCRFKIEETADNETYNTVYTSSEDETDITHALYSVLATDSNGISADGINGIAISRKITALRCTMYAAGGFAQVLDIETIPVAIDVDALTHEDIFNLLTNDGSWQGIYRGSDGKLYINFTYGRGGALTLGGLNNVNGILKMLDGQGNLIGQWDKSGLDLRSGSIQGSDIKLYEAYGGTIAGYGSPLKGSKETFLINSQGMKLYPQFLDGSQSLINLMPDIFNGMWLSKNTDGTGKSLAIANDSISVLKSGSANLNSWAPGMQSDVSFMTYDEICVQTEFLGKASRMTPTEISTTGSKSRIVQTENYNERLQYCYETPTPMFGDIGTARTDETGKCYIDIDDVFQETVNTDVEYQVFLQKEGRGDIWIEKKTPTYFLVQGTKNLKFSWELKVVQRDYEYERLEEYNREEKEEEIDYEQEYIDEINSLIEEQEEILNETVE